jgi:hypothetical protein
MRLPMSFQLNFGLILASQSTRLPQVPATVPTFVHRDTSLHIYKLLTETRNELSLILLDLHPSSRVAGDSPSLSAIA